MFCGRIQVGTAFAATRASDAEGVGWRPTRRRAARDRASSPSRSARRAAGSQAALSGKRHVPGAADDSLAAFGKNVRSGPRCNARAQSGPANTTRAPFERRRRCARHTSTFSRTGRSTSAAHRASTAARPASGSTAGRSHRPRPRRQARSRRPVPGSPRKAGANAAAARSVPARCRSLSYPGAERRQPSPSQWGQRMLSELFLTATFPRPLHVAQSGASGCRPGSNSASQGNRSTP